MKMFLGSVVLALGAGLVVPVSPVQAVSIPSAVGPEQTLQALPKQSQAKVAGSPARWVQSPYLVRKGRRVQVTGSLYLDPYRGASPSGRRLRSAPDRVKVRTLVAKKRSSPARGGLPIETLPSSAYLQTKTTIIKPKKRGLYKVKVLLNRKASKQLRARGYKGQRAAISVSALHLKDTKQRSPKWQLKQYTPSKLASGRFSSRYLRKSQKLAQQQIRFDRQKRQSSAQSSSLSAQLSKQKWAGNTPFYNYVYVQNWTPFTQDVVVNPDIMCMWTGNDPDVTPGTQLGQIPAGGTFQAVIQAVSTKSAWPGLIGATSGMNAPGTQNDAAAALSKDTLKTGESLNESVRKPSTFKEAGAATAAGAAGLTFVTAFFENLENTCKEVSDYPELFGIATQVTGFGTDNAKLARRAHLNPVEHWNGKGQTSSGSNGSRARVSKEWAEEYLQPMLGAQTVSLYYWNGGQPAPMVSNNASVTDNIGGAATYAGGLIQFAGVNPGFPGTVDYCIENYYGEDSLSCNYNPAGSLVIQLQYLTNPNGVMGLWNLGGKTPELTVEQDGDGGYNLACSLSEMDATLSLPYGYGNTTTMAQSSSMMGTTINSNGDTPQNGVWLVNFFGVATVKGRREFVYYGNSWQSQPQTGAIKLAELAPDAATGEVLITAAATSGSGDVQRGSVTASDMKNLYTASGERVASSDVTHFGCNATPSVDLAGLSITGEEESVTATAFGAIDATTNTGWPMPGDHDGWPTTAFTPYDYQTNWSWQQPVEYLNVTFKGTPVGTTTPLP